MSALPLNADGVLSVEKTSVCPLFTDELFAAAENSGWHNLLSGAYPNSH